MFIEKLVTLSILKAKIILMIQESKSMVLIWSNAIFRTIMFLGKSDKHFTNVIYDFPSNFLVTTTLYNQSISLYKIDH